jgi:large subunit ribosomal protein L31
MRKELHPLLKTMRVVMRNGASFNVQTVMNRHGIPYFLQTDTSTHPAWTGEREGVSLEDERIMKLMSKFGGFGGGFDVQQDSSPAGDDTTAT